MQIQKLSFIPTPAQLASLVSRNIGFYLDSADSSHAGSCYSYVGIKPDQIMEGDSKDWKGIPKMDASISGRFPFMSGWVGFSSYECGIQNILGRHIECDVSPAFWFGYFSRVIVIDHKSNEAFLCFERDEGDVLQLLQEPSVEESKEENNSHWTQTPEFNRYSESLEKIKKYLEAGDAYQVNYTERFEATTNLSTAQTYLRLRQHSAGAYGAFINTGEIQIYSVSPELFFDCDGRTIITRPIKGTVKRGADPIEDAHSREALTESVKANAELLMITDLERNDLGRVCEFGSVSVEELMTIETYVSVHHLVSTIRGKLKQGLDVGDAFEALFPGGSITGAPKKRAMEIIAELENHPRNVYTGAIGYVSASGQAMFNIPIRTLLRQGDLLYLHSGGGIVIDSEPQSEYEEMWMKIKGICGALGLKFPEF